jgi:hypothetical protein
VGAVKGCDQLVLADDTVGVGIGCREEMPEMCDGRPRVVIPLRFLQRLLLLQLLLLLLALHLARICSVLALIAPLRLRPLIILSMPLLQLLLLLLLLLLLQILHRTLCHLLPSICHILVHLLLLLLLNTINANQRRF